MKLLIAKRRCFCYGVKLSVNKAESLAEKAQDKKIFMYGDIVHNQDVVQGLKEQGLKKADDLSEVEGGSTVIIRAHGIPPQTKQALEAKNCKVIDCTCSFVKKVQALVAKESEAGQKIIVLGAKNHPEVLGICGYCQDEAIVIQTLEEAKAQDFLDNNYSLVVQTTFSVEEFEKIKKYLQKTIAKIRIFDTICGTTNARQEEASKIAKEADYAFVIGSRTSSNTKKLAETCLNFCPNTFLVEGQQDLTKILKEHSLRGKTVAVTAGASTPEHIFREVIQVMTENELVNNQQEQTDINFSDFIENIPQLKRGTIVKGTIVRYDDDFVYCDVQDKSEGRIPRHEFAGEPEFDLDKAIEDHLEIEVFVRNIRNSDYGKEITLSKARVDFSRHKEAVEKAFNEKTPLEVRVNNVVKEGVIASFGSVNLYIHRSQLDTSQVKDLESYLGKDIQVLISDFDPNRKRLRVSASRRSLLQRERRAKAKELWDGIEENKKYEGTVRSITNFGAFVDIGGVDGLVHVSELSWNRIKHPSEVVKVGDSIEVFVKEFDKEKKRISLGFRLPENDPYYDMENRFPVGAIVRGIVVRMFPFGAFVEIAPGVDALCHISQISDVRLNRPDEVLEVGMEVDARVLEINPKNRRISISIREVEPINPVRTEPEIKLGRNDVPTSYTDNVKASSLADIAGLSGHEELVELLEEDGDYEVVDVVELEVIEEDGEAVEEVVETVEELETAEEVVVEEVNNEVFEDAEAAKEE